MFFCPNHFIKNFINQNFSSLHNFWHIWKMEKYTMIINLTQHWPVSSPGISNLSCVEPAIPGDQPGPHSLKIISPPGVNLSWHVLHQSVECQQQCGRVGIPTTNNNIYDDMANVGAYLLCWTTNSSGTLALASLPNICSLGIHPSLFMRSIQWARISADISGSHLLINKLWKPSSHRNPLGKKDLLGTPVYSGASQYGTGMALCLDLTILEP